MATRSSLFARLSLRIRSDEGGFTMVEAMIAGLILAIGAFAIAQALTYGLTQTGMARQQNAAEAIANQQLELARSLEYDHVGLKDNPGTVPHSPNPNSPDYWVDAANQTYDPDGASPNFGYEPLVTGVQEPSLAHFQSPVVEGNTTYTVYLYVTWVDGPLDGLGAADTTLPTPAPPAPYQNCTTCDFKRVTVAITWPNPFHAVTTFLKSSSLFSDGIIKFKGNSSPGPNQAPTVLCPTSSVNNLTAGFTAVASDSDGTIAQVDWDFGDGITVTNGGLNQSHTYAAAGTYQVTNVVFDNKGANASNGSQNCTVTVTAPPPPPLDVTPPTGTISIANGSTYTNTTQVILNLTANDGTGSGLKSMQFSNDGVNYGAAVPYSTTALWTVSSGEGTKTVWVKYIDNANNVSVPYSDTIILDTTAPGAPTALTVTRSANKKTATLQWTAPFPLPGDLAGYQVWRRATTETIFTQVPCTFSYGIPTKCDDTSLDNKANYEYYVVSVDQAGNKSAESNHKTV